MYVLKNETCIIYLHVGGGVSRDISRWKDKSVCCYVPCFDNHTSSLRFHNGLTDFWSPLDNQEKLNHRAIRKQFLLTIFFNE